MTAYTPSYKVLINSVELTDVTVANVTITSGRTDIYSQPVAGYCQLQLLNFDNSIYDFTVGTGITIEVTDSTAAYVPIFGGYISDFTVAVQQTGSLGFTTAAQITALGALSKLPKIVDNGILSQDEDGDQIYHLLSGFLLGEWNQVPAATTWATYTPATGTWANALNLGLGEIDRPGDFLLIARSASETDVYSLCSQIANSALGVLYEEANGNIGYADSTHRQDYLATNGYGLAVTTRAGDIRNKYAITYGNNANHTYVAEDLDSIETYGQYGEAFLSNIKNAADAEDFADRIVALRADPTPKFQSITFELGNPEIDDADRDALINIFMGQPVWIQNLPLNIAGGSFEGYIEGWTFRASLNNLTITFNASPVNFSQIAVKWQQVNVAEQWNTLSPTLTWLNAIGAVA